MTDTFGAVKYCYISQVLEDGHIHMQRARTKNYEAYGDEIGLVSDT